MKIKYIFLIPLLLWSKIFKYYFLRIFGLPTSSVESNWIYFLKKALIADIKISSDGGDFVIYNPKFNHYARVRGGDSSDILVYIQIFFHGEYETLIRFFGKREKSLSIIDAGTNVGFFALYANYFSPSSTIYCIEPSQDNCVQIKKQEGLNGLTNLRVEQAALWYKDSLLELTSKSDHLEWNYTVIENKVGHIKAITLSELIHKYALKEIDIFKMDIEGAESMLFEDIGFLELVKNRVKVMAIETHNDDDHYSIANWLRSNHFHVVEKAELIFASRL